VASLQVDSVGVPTALSPVCVGHFKFYLSTSIVGLGLTAFSHGSSPKERKIIVLDPKAEDLVFSIKTYLTVDDSFCMVPIQATLQQESIERLLQAFRG